MPHQERHEQEQEFSFKSLFVPFTTFKAIHFIILIGLLVYANSLFNGFVGDDWGQILTNPEIHSLANFPHFFKGSTLFIAEVGQNAGLYYRPLLSFTFAAIFSLFGATSFPFHLFQILLHITNSILVFLLFRKHLRMPLSFVLSLIFLVHPINNEAVVYISNLQEELFAFYGLLALNVISFRKGIYIAPFLLLFSLLSKETGVIFIPMLIFYYFLFCKNDKGSTQVFVSSIVSVFIFYLLLRIFVGNTGMNTHFLYMSVNATFLERLYTLPSIVTYYLKIVFFPISLAFGWYWVIKDPSLSNFGYPFIVTLIFSFVILIPLLFLKNDKQNSKLYLFFLLFFILSFAPALQLFPLDLTVADRWFYIPLFGLLGICGVLYEKYYINFINTKNRKRFIVIIVVVSITLLGIRDFVRNTNWVDSYTLCDADEKVNTRSYILEFCLGNELYNRKDYKKAELHAQKAVEFYPEYFYSWYTLGKIYYATNEHTKAEYAFKKSLQYNDFALGSEELALLYIYEKNTPEAKNITTTYLKKLPYSSKLWYALALINYTEGRYSEATLAAKRAYELNTTDITQKVYIRLQNNLPIKF